MRTKSGKGWGHLSRTIARALAGAKINGSESRVLWAIVYKTIAFTKADDRIPWSQISDLTGIDQWNLTRPINSLLKKGVIFMKDGRYGIEEDFSKWKIPSNQMVLKDSPSNRKDSPSNRKDSPSKQMDSRDLLIRTNQERGFIKPGKEKLSGKSQAILENLIKGNFNMPGK